MPPLQGVGLPSDRLEAFWLLAGGDDDLMPSEFSKEARHRPERMTRGLCLGPSDPRVERRRNFDESIPDPGSLLNQVRRMAHAALSEISRHDTRRASVIRVRTEDSCAPPSISDPPTPAHLPDLRWCAPRRRSKARRPSRKGVAPRATLDPGTNPEAEALAKKLEAFARRIAPIGDPPLDPELKKRLEALGYTDR